MKKKLLSTVVALAALCGVPHVNAQLDWNSFYFGSSGALSFHDNIEIDCGPYTSPGPLVVSSHEEHVFDLGGARSLFVGYEYDCWRVELEGGFRQHNLDYSVLTTTGNAPTSGINNEHFTRTISVLLNGYYDYCFAEGLGAYVGLGVGYGYHRLRLDDGGNIFVDLDVKNHEFAWQAMGGFSYEACPRATVFLGYRFFGLLKPGGFNRGVLGAPIVNAPCTWDHFPYMHEVQAGVRIKL